LEWLGKLEARCSFSATSVGISVTFDDGRNALRWTVQAHVQVMAGSAHLMSAYGGEDGIVG